MIKQITDLAFGIAIVLAVSLMWMLAFLAIAQVLDYLTRINWL